MTAPEKSIASYVGDIVFRLTNERDVAIQERDAALADAREMRRLMLLCECSDLKWELRCELQNSWNIALIRARQEQEVRS